MMKTIYEFKNKIFLSANELKTEFFKLNNVNWRHIKTNDELLEAKNISSLLKFQEILIKEVIKIHKEEKNCPKNVTALIDAGIITRKLFGKLKGSFSYHDMYYLDQECDYYFVGDIHSDSYVIAYILEKCDFFNKVFKNEEFKLIFLGDYVDRGKNHLKTVQTMLLLKYLFPKHIYLLMGNHDIGNIKNGKVTLYLRKKEKDMDYFYIYLNYIHETNEFFTDELLELYLEVMNTLNVSAFVITDKATIKGVHGGIPRADEKERFDYLTRYEQLTDETKDYHDFRIRDCILWSDPSLEEVKPPERLRRFKFYEDQFINYLSHFGLDAIVRGHQAIEEGCLELFNQQLYTIFSSGRIIENNSNINRETAYDFVTPKILYYNYRIGLPMIQIDVN